MMFVITSCDDTKSYSELLTDEEHAVNWYLAQSKVNTTIPEDSVFEVGPNAPFYKMTYDGTVYMRVLELGDTSNKPKSGDRVYFTFMRKNIKDMYDGKNPNWEGNEENMSLTPGGTSFFLDNTVLPSTTQYGTGIQIPVKYLGYNCQVELVVKSLEGFSADMTQCIPYIIRIRYFQSIY